MFYPFGGPKISFQEITVPDLSPADKDTVRSGLEGLEDVDHIQPSSTEQFDDPHVIWVLQTHGAGILVDRRMNGEPS